MVKLRNTSKRLRKSVVLVFITSHLLLLFDYYTVYFILYIFWVFLLWLTLLVVKEV